MNLVEQLKSLLPLNAKLGGNGWYSFNAVCCHHRHQRQDTRKRGGLLFAPNGVQYHCFNCKFSTGWETGKYPNDKFKTLLKWFGLDSITIGEFCLQSSKEQQLPEQSPTIKPVELPNNTQTIAHWLNQSTVPHALNDVVDYLLDRCCNPLDPRFYWSDHSSFQHRVILPVTVQSRVTGFISRSVNDDKLRYFTKTIPHSLYNLDQQLFSRKMVMLVEGAFDAIAIDGVAVLGSHISPEQATVINSLNKSVVLVPDQDMAGIALIDQALRYNWSVAFPEWHPTVKDCSLAVKQDGKLFTLVNIMQNIISDPFLIAIHKSKLIEKISRNYEKIL